MNKCFIKVQYQSINLILLFTLQRRQEWRIHSWKVRKVVGKYWVLSCCNSWGFKDCERVLASQGGISATCTNEIVGAGGLITVFNHSLSHSTCLLSISRPVTLAARIRRRTGIARAAWWPSHLDLRLQHSIQLELLNIVQCVSNLLIWKEWHLGNILIKYYEKLFSLICFDYVFYDIVWIFDVYPKHLNCLTLILNLFLKLLINCFFKAVYPDVMLIFIDNSWVYELGSHQEVLVNIVNQVLKVDVHASFSINRSLLTCQQMIKLNNSNRYRFKFLALNHKLS